MSNRVPDLKTIPVEPELHARQATKADGRRGRTGADSTDTAVDVSVCIANWNCREMLRACLKSLLEPFHGLGLEVVVVDNASADGAAEMVEREFPEVILIRNSVNRGFATANNQAAEAARGRFLLFLNNDTEVPPGSLLRLLEYLEGRPEVGMVGPRLRDLQGTTQVSYRQLPSAAALLHRTYLLRWTGLLRGAYRRYRRQTFDPSRTRQVEVLMGAAVLMRRHVFFECGGWDEAFAFGGEDLDLSARVGKHYSLTFLPEAEIVHHGRVSTRLNIGYATPSMAVGFVRYLRKSGCSPWTLFCYKLVISLDTPLHLAAKSLQYVCRRLRGRTSQAERSLLVARGLWHFLSRGMIAFWKA